MMDFFLDCSAFFYAVVKWSHPRFGKFFSLFSLVTVGAHFVMKAVTYPVPPAEAGLFDAGPLVGLWFTVVVVQVARHLPSMKATESELSTPIKPS